MNMENDFSDTPEGQEEGSFHFNLKMETAHSSKILVSILLNGFTSQRTIMLMFRKGTPHPILYDIHTYSQCLINAHTEKKPQYTVQ
jgi:hypothetical protein